MEVIPAELQLNTVHFKPKFHKNPSKLSSQICKSSVNLSNPQLGTIHPSYKTVQRFPLIMKSKHFLQKLFRVVRTNPLLCTIIRTLREYSIYKSKTHLKIRNYKSKKFKIKK